MQYKYATEQFDYSDFSSGRVFYSLPGHPAFPVRLASEVFQRCLAHRAAIFGTATPCTLYDPCCGAAYHLSVLGLLHGEQIHALVGSDVDETAVALAARNLGLLHRDGLAARVRELSGLLERYGKQSHREALRSAAVFEQRLSERKPLDTKVFQASASDPKALLRCLPPKSIDIVFTDIPYGRHSWWQDPESSGSENPLGSMLDALPDVLSPSSIVAISSDKQQKARHAGYQRLEGFQVGKRRIVILKTLQASTQD